MDQIRLEKLILSLVDESISSVEKSELLAALRQDVSARNLYLQHMNIHAELCSLESTENYFDSIPLSNLDTGDIPKHLSYENYYAPRSWKFFTIAASMLILFVGWQAVSVWQNSNQALAISETPMLDEISPVTDDCKWYIEKSNSRRAESCQPGDVIRVTQGKLELLYEHGTKVVLHSPATYEFLSKMESKMILGRLTAKVSDSAKGFSVQIPMAKIVDLGTQFGVEVGSDGASDVVVFEGEVDVDYDESTDNLSGQRLTMGEAVHLDASGTPSRVLSIDGRSYSDQNLGSISRPAIITEVQDNIKRDSAVMNYYEIVHQGIQEDSLCFVDRIAHQWNGIESQGIPSYLLGADYVKTFNNDKYNQDIEIRVTLAAPCRLYIFVDDRLETPSWLVKEFKDTGDNIGMDVGPFFSHGKWHNRIPSGHGPGKSIDSILSIWVKEIREPSVSLLRGTEVTLGTVVTNMYGIAAAPLDLSN